jgi:DNA processing protein
LRDEALLVTRAEEVVELAGRIGELAPEQLRPVGPLDQLAASEKRIYDALPARGSQTVDEIAVAAGLPPHQVLGPLAMLELAGLVVGEAGCWRLSKRR